MENGSMMLIVWVKIVGYVIQFTMSSNILHECRFIKIIRNIVSHFAINLDFQQAKYRKNGEHLLQKFCIYDVTMPWICIAHIAHYLLCEHNSIAPCVAWCVAPRVASCVNEGLTRLAWGSFTSVSRDDSEFLTVHVTISPHSFSTTPKKERIRTEIPCLLLSNIIITRVHNEKCRWQAVFLNTAFLHRQQIQWDVHFTLQRPFPGSDCHSHNTHADAVLYHVVNSGKRVAKVR